jgi:hypothetical protein
LGSLLVLYHSTQPPTNEEWDDMLLVFERMMQAHGLVKTIVLTEGGFPSATQRAALVKVFGTGTSRTAILTRSTAGRAIVTALRWWNPTMATFSPDELPKAMEFLELEPGMRGTIERTLADLRLEVAQSLPKAAAR